MATEPMSLGDPAKADQFEVRRQVLQILEGGPATIEDLVQDGNCEDNVTMRAVLNLALEDEISIAKTSSGYRIRRAPEGGEA